MKSTLKPGILTAITALLVCFALPTLAQTKATNAAAKPKPLAATNKQEYPWDRKLQEFDYGDLSLSDLVNVLSEQFPEINFVVHSTVKDVPVSLKLRSVTLDDIFTALEISTKNTVRPIDANSGLPMPVGTVRITKVNERMVSFTQGEAAESTTDKPVCRAFSLNRYLAGKSDGKEVNQALEDIEVALQLAWDMLRAANPGAQMQKPILNLHRATKLLIVVGQPASMEVVQQIVGQLNGEPASGSAASGFVPGGIPGTANPFGAAVPGLPGGAPGISPSTPPPPGKR